MPKYRGLSSHELRELEKEFVDYLVLNGITADDWTEMKLANPDKAEKIIELFSDVVFETIFRKAQYLELRTSQELIAVQCLPSQMVVVGVSSEDNDSVDLLDPILFESYKTSPPNLKIFTSSTIYNEKREVELFQLTEKGYIISDGKLFKTLCLGL